MFLYFSELEIENMAWRFGEKLLSISVASLLPSARANRRARKYWKEGKSTDQREILVVVFTFIVI